MLLHVTFYPVGSGENERKCGNELLGCQGETLASSTKESTHASGQYKPATGTVRLKTSRTINIQNSVHCSRYPNQ
jgi:hypothetical protein